MSYEQIEQIIGGKLPADGSEASKTSYFWCSETDDSEDANSLYEVVKRAGWQSRDPGWERRIMQLRRTKN